MSVQFLANMFIPIKKFSILRCCYRHFEPNYENPFTGDEVLVTEYASGKNGSNLISYILYTGEIRTPNFYTIGKI